ncbi:4a-hydroxytetrahydrobiopterin dehydratase [Crocosphaera sp. XPORK-15E]|uniref:4a-hydroxytetrahydrobiopterin dehydratase n=1 Tax=Crocosphaera sp. XPORK-15E TaxID=3110247 RepID=UPI002B1F981D|nr:4a-hydroxytetrahydrobiopterin dehydratase [Crocosphaera sp. XPORK-15E]MEA5537065.1 4a-hydroxytetrahydrobiopterin dehydratase [Crocosphaera sp. XPORK-15E]
MEALSKQICVPCSGRSLKATEEEITKFFKEISQWQLKKVSEELRLERVYKFPDFQTALTFTQQVGECADQMGHHPALLTEWGQVTVTWWTHAIGGLHQNDFIMAAKTDEIAAKFTKN